MTDFLMEYIVMPGFALIAALLVLGMPFVIYGIVTAEASPTFALRKDQWECTAAHTNRSTMLVPAGKVLIPIPHETTVCDQWSAKGA